VRGFTLIELLVVLAILVMAAALFPLALNRALPGRRVSTTADRVVAALNEAEAESTAIGRPVTVSLVEGQLEATAENAHPLRRPLRFPGSIKVALTDLDGETATALTVFPDGSAQGGHFVIESGAHRSLVAVSGLTGRIAVRRER
jgi:general secretion pathway protein H